MKKPGFLLLLAVATFLAYIPALRSGFIWDDDYYVTDNRYLVDTGGLADIWVPGHTVQYYPMVFTTFWIEHKLWEFNPAGYHVTNILLHIAGALLLGSLLRYLNVPGAWLAAAVFALHPVHVESVAWITERKNVLSGFFYLAAMSAFLRFEDRRRYAWYALALLCFLFALLSKSVTCSLPAALILIRWFRGKPISLRYVAGLIPFFVVGLATGLHTAWYEMHHVGALGHAYDLSIGQRLLIAGRALWFYLAKLTWPANLTFIYPRWKLDTADFAQWLYPAGAVIVALVVWFLRGRWGRGPAVALAFMAGTLFPALGFFNVYPFRFSFVADHFQYLASAGWIALVSAVLVGALGRIVRRDRVRTIAAGTLGGGLLVVLGALTFQQARLYKNQETLWRETLRRNPDAWMAYVNLGLVLYDREDYERALEQYRRALLMGPEFKKDLARIHDGIAGCLRQMKRYAEARRYYLDSIELRPDHAKTYFNLAGVLDKLGESDAAVGNLQKALDIRPRYFKAEMLLGIILAKQGRTDEAIAVFQKIVRRLPSNARAHSRLAFALIDKRQFPEALAHAGKAVLLEPDSSSHRAVLAAALAAVGRHDEAADQCRYALQLNPDNHAARLQLAESLLVVGRYEQAIRNLRRQIETTPANPLAANRLAWLLATVPDDSLRRPEEAIRLARQVVQATWNRNPEALNTLAAAYAANNQFEPAVQTARRAFELATTQRQPELAADIQRRLETYKQNRSLYQPKLPPVGTPPASVTQPSPDSD